MPNFLGSAEALHGNARLDPSRKLVLRRLRQPAFLQNRSSIGPGLTTSHECRGRPTPLRKFGQANDRRFGGGINAGSWITFCAYDGGIQYDSRAVVKMRRAPSAG